MTQKLLLASVFFFLVALIACNPDDETGEYPKTVNIKFEVNTTLNRDCIIKTTINNDTEEEFIFNLPYSRTYAQEEVVNGTYTKITFEDNDDILGTPDGGSSWEDYEAELKISVDNEVVKSETVTVTEDIGVILLDYTFE